MPDDPNGEITRGGFGSNGRKYRARYSVSDAKGRRTFVEVGQSVQSMIDAQKAEVRQAITITHIRPIEPDELESLQSRATLRIAANGFQPSIILDALVPYDRAQDMQANLEEVYPIWVARYGPVKAEWIYRIQVLWLVGGTWWEKIISTSERLAKVFRVSGG